MYATKLSPLPHITSVSKPLYEGESFATVRVGEDEGI